MKRSLQACWLTALLVLAGCHRTRVVPTPPAPPPEMVSVPPPTHPTEPEPAPEVVETPPEPEAPTAPKRKPSPPRRKPAPAPSEPVAVVTPAPPPIDLGELTTGGEANSATARAQTEDLLRTQQRRLSAVPDATVKAHKQQMQEARMFLQQADAALKKQDVEGARTLATKAKVILDEVLE